MPRSHDKSHFFKYTSVSSALKILESRKLRWSAPSLFNDPFDHQATFRFDFGEADFIEHMVAAQERIVFGVDEPVFLAKKQLGVVSYLLRHALGGRDRGSVMAELRQAAAESAKNLAKHQASVNGLLTAHLSHSRVLCVSEYNDNVVMWSHYADNHKGVVLRLECLDDVDDNLLIARPVKYVNEFPSFATVDEWVRDLTGERPIDYAKLFFEPAYLKHVDWAYEKEWRVHIPLMPYEAAGDGTSFYAKDPRAFSGVYFGCRMAPADRAALLAVITAQYPEMRVFQAVQSSQSFALTFEVLRAGI